jgi:medium-chain acyl-[acyl-carrier-protein] hydrolase
MSRSWLVIPQRRAPPQARLVCFPYAGGGAAIFTGWVRLIPEEVQLISVQYPGRHHLLAEPAIPRMDELAERIAQQLESHFRTPLPTLCYGHSMGSLVAFEVLRRLRDRGSPLPRRLAVGAFSAPHLPFSSASFHLLENDDDFLEAVSAHYEDIPPEILADPEWRRMIIGALRADFELLHRYRFDKAPPLPVPIHAFAATQDSIADEHIAAWREHTSGSFGWEPIAGPHFFFRPDPTPLISRLLTLLANA